jgi:cellulose synthase (UDP-forming)
MVRVSYISFWIYYFFTIAVILVILAWFKKQRLLRPIDAKIISWEVAIFQMVRWPWILLGCSFAIADAINKKQFSFKVTPKGSACENIMPVKVLVPYAAIAFINLACVLIFSHANFAKGYYYLALLNGVFYIIVASVILFWHVHETHNLTENING